MSGSEVNYALKGSNDDITDKRNIEGDYPL